MRLTPLLLVAASGLVLAADPVAPISVVETQAGTRALPTGTCGTGGLGLTLTGLASLHAVLQCSDSSAFTGGTAQGYFCDPRLNTGAGGWTKAASYNDFVVPTATGVLGDGGSLPSVGPEMVVAYPFGRFLYALDGGTCAGGSWDGGVTVMIAGGQR